MGDPISLAVAGTLGVLSGGANYLDQRNNSAMAEAQRDAYNARVTEATIENYKEISEAESALNFNAHQDSLDNQIATLEAVGQVDAHAGARGTLQSSQGMVNQILQNSARNQTDITLSRDEQARGLAKQAEAIRTGAQQSYDNSIIKKPSIITSGLAGLDTGMKTYDIASGLHGSMKEAATSGRKVSFW